MDFFFNNWSEILLTIITAAGTITALTETEKDDKIVDVLRRILQAVVLGKNRRRLKK
jgi:hypothetical protein|tara:strand:+ start:8404 stop:8574 length:171 start_codon:yes stop_codon:yes gene_type:complete